VVNVELTDVCWNEATLLAGIFLMDCVWVLVLDDVTFIDCLAPVPALKRSALISEFNLGKTTD
jgi:hypothetical protein